MAATFEYGHWEARRLRSGCWQLLWKGTAIGRYRLQGSGLHGQASFRLYNREMLIPVRRSYTHSNNISDALRALDCYFADRKPEMLIQLHRHHGAAL